MGKRTGPLSEILADAADISPSGLEFSHKKCWKMKNVEMRMRRRNYVIDFSNFQVNISMNVKFHPGRRWKQPYECKRNLSCLAGQLGYRDHVNGPLV